MRTISEGAGKNESRRRINEGRVERRRKKAINTSSRYHIGTRKEQYKCPATQAPLPTLRKPTSTLIPSKPCTTILDQQETV
jgi:hypothetical protein